MTAKYSIPDGHWDQDDEGKGKSEPLVEVTRHTIEIDDRRDAHGYEYGLDWLFAVEEGMIVGYTLGHWLEGRTQSDYMNTPAWEDVPEIVKEHLRESLDTDSLETDLPDFYGEDYA